MMKTTTQLAFESRCTVPTADGRGMLHALPDKAPTEATNRICAGRAQTGQCHKVFRPVVMDWTVADYAVPIGTVFPRIAMQELGGSRVARLNKPWRA